MADNYIWAVSRASLDFSNATPESVDLRVVGGFDPVREGGAGHDLTARWGRLAQGESVGARVLATRVPTGAAWHPADAARRSARAAVGLLWREGERLSRMRGSPPGRRRGADRHRPSRTRPGSGSRRPGRSAGGARWCVPERR